MLVSLSLSLSLSSFPRPCSSPPPSPLLVSFFPTLAPSHPPHRSAKPKRMAATEVPTPWSLNAASSPPLPFLPLSPSLTSPSLSLSIKPWQGLTADEIRRFDVRILVVPFPERMWRGGISGPKNRVREQVGQAQRLQPANSLRVPRVNAPCARRSRAAVPARVSEQLPSLHLPQARRARKPPRRVLRLHPCLAIPASPFSPGALTQVWALHMLCHPTGL